MAKKKAKKSKKKSLGVSMIITGTKKFAKGGLIKTARAAKKKKLTSKASKASFRGDAARKAKKAGKRVSGDGNMYYENRPNRTDKKIKTGKYKGL